jgi:thioredoxin
MLQMKRKLTTLLAILIGLTTATACQNRAKVKKNDPKSEIKQERKKGMGTIALTKADFLKKVWNYEANPKEWKYLGDKPAIIDFFATWCGPCKMVSPLLEELSEEYDGKIVIYKVDVDQEEELSGAFGIRSVPSILFIPMKGQPQMTQGAMPKNDLKKVINEVLLK